MNQMQSQVEEFHRAFNVHKPESIEPLSGHVSALRLKLIDEEVAEFKESVEKAMPLDDQIKELCDVLYVVLGAAVSMGIKDIEPFFAEVHRSNMTKLWADGKPRMRTDGKVLKPDTYSQANFKGIN